MQAMLVREADCAVNLMDDIADLARGLADTKLRRTGGKR